MSASPLLVIAAGGTGGHMFPAQALAEEMLKRGWRVTLSTDARGARFTSGFPNAVSVREVASATFARGGIAQKVLVPFRSAAGLVAAALRNITERPDAVAGFGGYPSIPALSAAWALRTPRLIHEQNGVLGRVNQLFARRVNRVACGTWPTDVPHGVAAEHIGNPVRAAIAEKTATPYELSPDGPINILVMGGSQGARILSEIVPAAISTLPTPLRSRLKVSHLALAEDHARAAATYEEAGIKADVQPFFHDVPDRMSAAHLVISRAGASSVADISIVGRPSILIPLAAAIRDEQTANARGLVDAGAAVLMPESELDPGTLSEHILSILTTHGKAAEMAEKAAGLGIPDAAKRLANMVEQLAEARK